MIVCRRISMIWLRVSSRTGARGRQDPQRGRGDQPASRKSRSAVRAPGRRSPPVSGAGAIAGGAAALRLRPTPPAIRGVGAALSSFVCACAARDSGADGDDRGGRPPRRHVAQLRQHAIGDSRAATRAGTCDYNVAECHTAPWEEWLRNVADVCGWRGEIVELPAERLPESLQFPVPPGQDLYASSERIRDELGYTEPIDLGEGLRRAVQWEREQESNEPAPDYSDEDAVLGAFRSGSWEV
jgi:hypothetical protein